MEIRKVGVLGCGLMGSGIAQVAATAGFGVSALAATIPEFIAAYPEIEIDLHLTEDRVDIVADGFDLVVQIGQGLDSSLRISRLFSFTRPLVASPDFVARHGRPQHPHDLERLPALIPTHVPWADEWEFTRDGEDPVTVRVKGVWRVNSAQAMIPALLAGVGMTLMPKYYVWQDIEEGRLIELLPGWETLPGPIYLVTPPGRARPARVRVLIEFLRDHFATQSWAQGIVR